MRRWSAKRRRRRALGFAPFRPTRVDERAYRDEVRSAIDKLAPDGVDEVTGHAMDNLINAWADRWESKILQEHATYSPDVVYDIGVAQARMAREMILLGHDEQYLNDMMLAFEAAMTHLVGEVRRAEARRLNGHRPVSWRPELGEPEPRRPWLSEPELRGDGDDAGGTTDGAHHRRP